MKCRNESGGCQGTVMVSDRVAIAVQVGCDKFRDSFPCDKCGLLHFECGAVVTYQYFDRFFLEHGEIVRRDKDGEVKKRGGRIVLP